MRMSSDCGRQRAHDLRSRMRVIGSTHGLITRKNFLRIVRFLIAAVVAASRLGERPLRVLVA